METLNMSPEQKFYIQKVAELAVKYPEKCEEIHKFLDSLNKDVSKGELVLFPFLVLNTIITGIAKDSSENMEQIFLNVLQPIFKGCIETSFMYLRDTK